jgi:hypothetical protein
MAFALCGTVDIEFIKCIGALVTEESNFKLTLLFVVILYYNIPAWSVLIPATR